MTLSLGFLALKQSSGMRPELCTSIAAMKNSIVLLNHQEAALNDFGLSNIERNIVIIELQDAKEGKIITI